MSPKQFYDVFQKVYITIIVCWYLSWF